MNIDWNALEKRSEQLRQKMILKGRLKIERVYMENNMGPHYIMVQYLDYDYRARDEANLSDIIDWINWGEKFVDNFTFLKMQVENIIKQYNERNIKQSEIKYLVDDLDCYIKRELSIRKIEIIDASENAMGAKMYLLEDSKGNKQWYNISELRRLFG